MKKKKRIDIYKIILIISTIFIIVLTSLLILIRNTKDYRDVRIKKNKETVFNIADLKVEEIEYAESEKEVEKKLGKAEKEEKYEKNLLKYKKLKYKGIEIELRENYNDYMVVGVEVTGKRYKVGRGIKVGQRIEKAIKKYKVDNEKGTYLYGNYSINALNKEEIKSAIYIGARGKKEVTYVYRDEVIEGEKTNIARMTISYKKGKITKIKWIYDYE